LRELLSGRTDLSLLDLPDKNVLTVQNGAAFDLPFDRRAGR
jgi:hypothetical protein